MSEPGHDDARGRARDHTDSRPSGDTRLADRAAIHDVVMRYCRGVDRCDGELISSCYHEHAFDDHGLFRGPPDEFVASVVPAIRDGYETTMHFIGNQLIEFDGADLAYTESYFVAYHRAQRDGETFVDTFAGRYVDRFERLHETWKIAHRTVVYEWSRIDRVTQEFPGVELFEPARRFPDDIVYRPGRTRSA